MIASTHIVSQWPNQYIIHARSCSCGLGHRHISNMVEGANEELMVQRLTLREGQALDEDNKKCNKVFLKDQLEGSNGQGNCQAIFLYYLHSFSLQFSLLILRLTQLERKTVAGGPRHRDYPAPPVVPRLSHSLGDSVLNSEYPHNLQASSQSKRHAMEHSQDTGKRARKVQTQASTQCNAAEQQIPKRRVLTTKRSSGVQSSYTQSDDTLI